MNSGISRSVFFWYSAYGGYAATAISHHLAFSSPVASLATMSCLTGPSCSSTSGCDFTLWYQTGCLGAPPREATTAYSSPSTTRISGVLRILPDLAPIVVRMTTGRPFCVVPDVPPDPSYSATWLRARSDGLGSYSPCSGMPPVNTQPLRRARCRPQLRQPQQRRADHRWVRDHRDLRQWRHRRQRRADHPV